MAGLALTVFFRYCKVWRSSHGATIPNSEAEKSVQDEQGISQFATVTTTSHFVCVIEEDGLDDTCQMVLDFVKSFH